MSTIRQVPAGRIVVCALVAMAAAGCTTSARSLRSPMLAFASPGPPPACTVDGLPHVVATRVSALAGLEAQQDGATVRLRLARSTGRAPWALALEPGSLEVLASEPADAAPAKATGSLRPTLDGLRSDAVRVQAVPHSGLQAWAEGSMETGLTVRVQSFGAERPERGALSELAHEGSAIGLPAAALASSGRGVVAFIESGDEGFQIAAASLDCRGGASTVSSGAGVAAR